MKQTDDLREELMETTDLRRFLAENQQSFHTESIGQALNAIFLTRDISKAALARSAGMSEVYLHQVFSGHRTPSRSRLICLCFGLSVSMKQTQALLRQSGYAQLYPKNRRDAIILYGLHNGLPLCQVNDQLFDADEEPLF